MDRLTSMLVFTRAVERGAFAAVATELGLSAAMVGLHVRALETRLGSRLLNRTTRRQSLTEAGRAYYAECKRLLADIDGVEADIAALRTEPRGSLRVAAPVSFGVHALAGVIAEYLARYPEVDVDVSLNDRTVDLIEDGFDVALRIGALSDSTLVAKPLAPYRMMVCAAPSYLRRHGKPRTPLDLSGHNCLAFAHRHARNDWTFQGPRGPVSVRVRGRFRVNNGEALRVAACRGLGIIRQPEVLLRHDVHGGRLVSLLDGYTLEPQPMHVLYVPNRRASAKLRTFVDLVVQRFGRRAS